MCFPCNRCNKFVAKSKSSLAAHQKGRECLKIYNANNVTEEVILNLNENAVVESVKPEIKKQEKNVQATQEPTTIVTQVSQTRRSKTGSSK